MSFFFSFLSFSVFLQIERERKRGYIKLGIRRNSPKVYLSFFDGLLWRIFFLLRADRLYLILSTGLKKWLLRVQDIFFVFFYLEFLALVPSATNPVQQLIFLFSFFPWREEGATSVLGSQPIIWLLPSSFPCQATPYPSGHQVQTSVFPFWLGFVTLGLTHILSCLNGHSLMACQFKHEDSSNLISIVPVGHHLTVWFGWLGLIAHQLLYVI